MTTEVAAAVVGMMVVMTRSSQPWFLYPLTFEGVTGS